MIMKFLERIFNLFWMSTWNLISNSKINSFNIVNIFPSIRLPNDEAKIIIFFYDITFNKDNIYH